MGRCGAGPAAGRDPGQHRQAEGERLAGAGLAAAEHVPAGERVRDGGGLDRERAGDLGPFQGAQQRPGHAELAERRAGGLVEGGSRVDRIRSVHRGRWGSMSMVGGSDGMDAGVAGTAGAGSAEASNTDGNARAASNNVVIVTGNLSIGAVLARPEARNRAS